MDKPGTVRTSIHGDVAILTTDQDNAPWILILGAPPYADQPHWCWATNEEVKDWTVRTPTTQPPPMKAEPGEFADLIEDVCLAESPRHYMCGLEPDHDGQHEARIEDDTVVDLWD